MKPAKRQGGPTITLRLLGTPTMAWQAQPFTLPRRQARALLYRLAADGQPVPREALADLLWPDKAPAAARRNLSRLLSYLRGQLPQPELLQIGKTAVSLTPHLATSDVIQFTHLCQSNEPTKWETAVSLYRGSFLAGFSLKNSRPFDHWLTQEQQRLEHLHLETLRRLVKASAHRPEKAIQFAQTYLAIDDLAEDIQRQLIRLYAANGNRSAALRQYEQCVIVLERELGVQSLPETRAVYEAVRDNRQPASPPKAVAPEWATLPSLDLPLIGRESEWEMLAAAYGRFHSGGVLFISGEAGVGKSRLMQTFATAQSSLVLASSSHAGSQTLPYQPLVQALRLALPLRDRFRHVRPIWLAEAARLLPELALHFPDLPAPVEVEAVQAQARLFEALTQLFRSLATDTPLLLCLDDLHWADEATHGWLRYVRQQLNGSQLCILATYRTQEADSLDEWRRELARSRLMADVKLDGLAETAVTALLKQADANIAAPEKLAARIHAATGGNAFFVLETVRELLETDQLADPPADLPLPPTVRETVLRRVARLSPLPQQILEITAVLSPTLRFPLIQQTGGRDELETADSLEELVKHQLLLADGDRFRFQHHLAREAVYQNISGWRRQLLHRRAAHALENLPNQGDAGLAATIATHFEAAGEMGQAIAYYRQAATVAQSLYAHQEAIEHLQRAIALAEGAGADTSTSSVAASTSLVAVLPYLYETLADNLTITGKFSAAEAAYRLALALTADNDPLLLAELERKLAATLPSQQRSDEAETIYRAALARLDGLPPTGVTHQCQSTRLNILLNLMDTLYFQHKPEEMAALKEQTEALLAAVGTAVQRANYYSRLSQIAFLQNRYRVRVENIANSQTTLAYAQESGNPRLIARQQFHHGFQLLWYGNLGEAEEYLRHSLTAAEALGDFWLLDQCLAYLNILYRLQGKVAQVAAQLPHLIEVSQAVGYNNYIGVAQANAAWLHYRAGEWSQAQAEAQVAVTTWDGSNYPFQWLAHWLLLAVALRQNRLPDGIGNARALMDVKQQKLLAEMEAALVTAVSTWEADDEVTARDGLETAVQLAQQHGYL